MKKLLLIAAVAVLASILCTVSFADDGIVFDAYDLYDIATAGGGLTISDELMYADDTVYVSAYVNGQKANGVDSTQINFEISDTDRGDFLLKEYPVAKMVYKTDIKNGMQLDFNLGMNFQRSATRLWGYFPVYVKGEVKSELIFDMSKSFTGGANLSVVYSWDYVDNDSHVNYFRFKPFYNSAKMNEGEYFSVEYVAFFKSEADAKAYKHESRKSIELEALNLNMEAVRMNPGETTELVPLAKPHFATLTDLTYTSDDPSIATVDEKGVVTAVSAGDTYITAASGDIEVKCHVFVIAGKLPAVHFVPKSIKSSKVSVAALGDSITTYTPDSTKNYHDWWAYEYNVTNYDYGICGSQVSENGPNPFVNRYDDMADDIDIVFVKGGTNDFSGTSLGDINDRRTKTYIGALRTLMEGLIEKYPDRHIVFLTPIRRCDLNRTVNTQNGYGNTLNDYANAVVMLGEQYGIETVNIYAPDELDFTSEKIAEARQFPDGIWPEYADSRMPDGLHPSGEGHKILADYILNELSEKGVIAVHNTDFTDTVSHWGCTYIDTVARLGLFKGVTESEFSPNGTMTRAMAVTVLSRLANDTENKSDIPYADVNADAWFRDGVAFAYSQGIVDSGDTFRPDDNITREELADMLYRFAKNDGKSVSLAEIDFADNDAISSTCSDGVAYCVNSGIIKGYDDNTFKPDASATRAEVATMIVRFINA